MYLKQRTDSNGYLKKNIMKITKDTKLRELMQYIGTDLFRNQLHSDTWVNALMKDYKPVKSILESTVSVKHGLVTHGDTYLRLYRIWKNMKSRCTNSNHPKYEIYGKKGISVEWSTYEQFKEWSLNNGYKDTLTIDRIDLNGNYNSSNCRWTTYAIQASNKGKYVNNTSGYRGVSFKKRCGKWCAQIQINNKKTHLGYFDSAEEASEIYEQALVERDKLYNEEFQDTIIYPRWVISDCRFENEVKAIKDRGGIVIRVNRPLYIYELHAHDGIDKKIETHHWVSVEDPGNFMAFNAKVWSKEDSYKELMKAHNEEFPQHESETALDAYEFDYVLENDKDIPGLIEEVKKMLVHFKIL